MKSWRFFIGRIRQRLHSRRTLLQLKKNEPEIYKKLMQIKKTKIKFPKGFKENIRAYYYWHNVNQKKKRNANS